MRKASSAELKRIQLDILNVVADFCERNAIRYWIDSGTLLGAIRHKGYIPWDDDIDIGMLREDYNRFAGEFNEQNGQYRFVSLENTPNFYLPHGKVCDTNTVLYEPDERGYKLAINIDIFVYDNAPDDDRQVKYMYDIRDRLLKAHSIKNENMSGEAISMRNILKYFRRCFYRAIYPKDNLVIRLDENAKRYEATETKRVGNFTAFTRMICGKQVFDSFIDVEFEGKQYKAPVGYDEWLRSFYGDYMQLPPVDQRVSHHSFVAYIND